MAAALLAGLAGKLTAGANIHVVDPNADALARLQQQFGVTVAPQIDAAVAASDVVVLAVKPQQMRDVAAQLRPHIGRQLVLSIAAGIRGADLSRWLGGHSAIVRTMPNTPALIGQGITGMAALAGVSASQREAADAIMRAVGATVWLEDESLIDPVTAVSGSGPAYVFYFIEAMQQAAQEMGLSAEQGTQLAIATFTGAAQLAAQSAEPVSVLRRAGDVQGRHDACGADQHGIFGREGSDRARAACGSGAGQGAGRRIREGLTKRFAARNRSRTSYELSVYRSA